MDAIKEFIDGLNSVDMLGVPLPRSRWAAVVYKVEENLAFGLVIGLVLLVILILAFSVAVQAAIIRNIV